MAEFALTPADLRSLALRGDAFADFSDEEIQPHLDGAIATAYGYIRSRYPVPIEGAPLDLKIVCCKIAAVRLLVDRGYSFSTEADAALEREHDRALGYLRDVANGRVSLDLRIAPAPSAGALIYPRPLRGW